MSNTLSDFLNDISNQKRRYLVLGKDIWADYSEAKTVLRYPAFTLDEVSKKDIKSIFKDLSPIIISYATHARDRQDGYLYVCSDNTYHIDSLERNARRDARRALRTFDIKFVTWDFLLQNGYEPYKDTRTRNKLSDNDRNRFEKLIKDGALSSCDKCLAAIDKETNEVAAFLMLTEVDNWVEISASFSANKHLHNCPNNGLFHFILDHYLVQSHFETVSYGYSSIQTGSNRDSLHLFKEKVGFKALPVKRQFIIKPAYKVLINPVSEWLIRLTLLVAPRNRILNKIDGMLKIVNK